MINFAASPIDSLQGGQLMYRRQDYAFDTVSEFTDERGISVVVNDVELFVDDNARVIYVRGYCPYQGWEQTDCSPPAYSRNALVVIGLDLKTVEKGMAFRLNDSKSWWPVSLNPEGWICIGAPAEQGDKAVEFAPSCVAVLNGGRLVALWLRPLMRGD